ncbi:Elongator complex protein 1 [Paramicrosporidium saccamoebae]|uniref:Elongator complex protein 1 n=1 Tax=Paramicrosporidium saccamoebae TaxID=1246581 RepID=A0A2H9TMW0_9FUNG|nr:Elongator complex protein 1 [Paramicrosporidium saccamoebae]
MENLGIYRWEAFDTSAQYLLCDGSGNVLVVTQETKVQRLGQNMLTISPSLPKNDILSGHVSSFDNSILICYANGDLVLCIEEGTDLYTSEVVGSIPSGVAAFAVSPDGELVSIVSIVDCKATLIILLRSSLSMVCELRLEDIGDTSEHQVSVGWGKKETQFHGSAGKQAAQQVAIKEALTEEDDGKPRLSWRNDSAFFSCSLVVEGIHGMHRQIVVVDREGTITSIKEPIAGLGHALSWRRDGSLISASQRSSGMNKIVFFERNGLKHGEFTLYEHGCSVQDLSWNCNGTILAARMSDGRVDLWTTTNHHWYLKKTLHGCGGFWWNEIYPLKFSYTNGDLIVCELFRTIDRSFCDFEDDLCMVAVIDGSQLLLTPFGKANIPPPMSFAQINVGFVPDCVALYCAGSKGRLVASGRDAAFLTSFCIQNGALEFSETTLLESKLPLRQVSLTLESVYGLSQCNRLCILKDGIIQPSGDASFYTSISSRACGVVLLDSEGTAFLQNDGAMEQLDSHYDCTPWLSCFQAKDRVITVGRTEDDRVIVDGTELAGCTSFILHPEFLTTTDRDGVARFYPLSRDPSEWLLNKSNGEEMMRHTEGGAICVAVIPKSAALVVQMPRGNLETVFPRAFVLSQVRRCLNSLAYRDAFLLCRRHRVDLNIIHDNNPELFMSTIGKFVQDVQEIDYLNLFMSSLNSANVSLTRYGAFSVIQPTETPDKINNVCTVLRQEFLKNNTAAKFAECIMTSWVCQSPPDYRAALQTIVDLTSSDPTGVEKALKYLIFLVPAEKLYKVALGMYNLPLALSVARRSQMDPSEYTVLLEELHTIDSQEYQMYRIDDFLQNYDAALIHLIESEADFQTCLSYCERHELYRTAFSHYTSKGEWRLVCKSFAEFLINGEKSDQAIDLLAFSGDTEEACNVAIRTGFWQKVVQLSSAEDRAEKCHRVVATLCQRKRYEEALRVSELYCGGSDALEIAIQGHLWTDAARIAHHHNLEMTAVLQVAMDSQRTILEELAQVVELFEEKAARLELVQTQLVASIDPAKIRQELERADGMSGITDGMSEMSFRTTTSYAGSQISQLSRATGSRSKKKADRQRMRGKPGSPFEREYLRDTLKDHISRIVSLRASSVSLVHFLASEQRFDDARTLQTSFDAACLMMNVATAKLKRLVDVQEEKMGPEILEALGLSPWSVPSTLQVNHTWKSAFDLPPNFGSTGRLEYL